jgi:beta-glucosidase
VVGHPAALAICESGGSPADCDGHLHDGAVRGPRGDLGGAPRGLTALPPGFVLGTCTAATVVEGAVAAEGRGQSVWDTFARRFGAIADGSNGDVAADAYHRTEEDLDLLARLGARGHRFSISWSRVLPFGAGEVNHEGLDHYDRFVDGLLERGIEPMVTLYHSDLPQPLEDEGGWLNPDTVERYAEYAAIVGARLADRVAHWVPVASPNAVTMLGYSLGVHAPGRTLTLDALPVAHHLLVAHGRGTIALRDAGARSVGCSNHHSPMWPASEEPADVGATKLFDALWNGLYLEPMLLGRYPTDLLPLLDDDFVQPGDLAVIRQPLDFYGVAYSGPLRVAAAPPDAEVPFVTLEALGHPTTDNDNPIVPEALREWLIMFRARYRAALPPIVVTECGASFDDVVAADGSVDDDRRVDFLERHLAAVSDAAQRGVDVRGFYASSLLDGFAWADGFAHGNGLVHVDRITQERTPKASFHWLAAQVAAQTKSLG